MKHSSLLTFSRRSMPSLLAVLLLMGSGSSLLAEVPKSLLPAFGTEGVDFVVKGKDGHVTKGWLPKEWTDNSEWAAVNGTYTKLTDSPDKDAGAVRIKVEAKDEGQLQFTTYGGNQKYKKGTRYVVSGWLRSSDRLPIHVGIRQIAEPYEFYHEEEQSTDTEWKRFEFGFTPTMDFPAFLMFAVRDTGTVDIAGIAIEEKP